MVVSSCWQSKKRRFSKAVKKVYAFLFKFSGGCVD